MIPATRAEGQPVMHERGIIFSAPMVKALLSGTKTQTRRIVNLEQLRVRLPYEVRSDLPIEIDPHPLVAKPGIHRARANLHGAMAIRLPNGQTLGIKPGEFDFVCPYVEGTTRLFKDTWCIQPHGQQRLWVRETWCNYGGRPIYRANYQDGLGPIGDGIGGPWRPSIFMPRNVSRIALEVTGVRVERLQAITEADARAEGASFHDGRGVGHSGWRHDERAVHATARDSYARLWDEINGKKAPWASNPFVWTVSFKRVSQ